MRAEDAVSARDAANGKDSRATLATVAASAGVSVATVSKVLNGRSDVAPATRALVQDLLEEHDYVGRRADPGRLVTVELMFHDPLNAYSLEVFEGILTTADELDAAVAVSLRPRGEGRSAAARSSAWVRGLVAAGRSAVITVTSELPGSDLSALSRARIPVVVIDPFNLPRTKVISVGSTNFTGGLSAAGHLLELGHRQIGILALGRTGPGGVPQDSDSYPARQRLGGWREVLLGAGVEPVVALAPYEPREAAIAAARRLLKSAPLTAVLCFSDVFAHAVVLAAEELGRSVPDDLSVVGYDDAPFATTVRPTLTTVRQDISAKGHLAAGMLADLLAGRSAESQLLPATLVVRGSTAPLRA